MPTTNLPFGLELKNSLHAHSTFFTLLNETSDIIKSIPEYAKLKGNPELILLLCRILEIKMTTNTTGIDKKELVLCIYQNVFGEMTDDDKAVLKSNVQFLYDNKKIKPASVLKSTLAFGSDYIKRKFL
jgi:hypothetical protein